MIGWSACTMEPNIILRWIECHPASVMTIQAIATFLAIVAAIAVPLCMAESDRRRRAEEKCASSEAFVVSLLAPASHVLIDTARVRVMVTKLEETEIGSPQVLTTLRAIRVVIPDELSTAMTQMHLLDNNVVGRMRTAITHIQSFNVVVDQLVAATSYDVSKFEIARADAIPMLKKNISDLRERLEDLVGLSKTALNKH